MCGRLAGRDLRLVVDGEPVALSFTRDEALLRTRVEQPHVELATSRRTILDVVDARATLVSAALIDALTLRGRPDDVLAFHEGLVAYVHGGVRAPSFRGLLREFRDEAARR
jgi:hypothetical protein